MTLSDERKSTLAELRASAETTSQKEGQPGAPTSAPAWMQGLESQRQELFDALFAMIEDDKAWCDAFVEQVQANPEKLFKQCTSSREAAHWTLQATRKEYYKNYLKEHKEACLQHIAFLELVVRDLYALQSCNADPVLDKAPQTVILPRNRTDLGLPLVMRSLSQASEHIAAIRMLMQKDHYLASRRKGGQTKASVLEEVDCYNLLRPMVKILLKSESHSQHGRTGSEMTERYVTSIIEVWKHWPFFHFNRDTLVAMVETILVDLNVIGERKKSLFERRRRTPMTRPQRFSPSTELEADKSGAWQGGLASALVHILETSFGSVSEEHIEKIGAASPEQLCIWLCRTRKANSQDEVLVE